MYILNSIYKYISFLAFELILQFPLNKNLTPLYRTCLKCDLYKFSTSLDCLIAASINRFAWKFDTQNFCERAPP